MRGTAITSPLSSPGCRITPACAGNSILRAFASSPSPDHPRVCGEQAFFAVCVPIVIGSPPRVRGTAMPKASISVAIRITPACAGNSPRIKGTLIYKWDHPRVCGEQAFNLCLSTLERGSPPRVRGTGFKNPVWLTGFRITPACAGNRHLFHKLHSLCKDHPRVCGEQHRVSIPSHSHSGSPPRVRGTA